MLKLYHVISPSDINKWPPHQVLPKINFLEIVSQSHLFYSTFMLHKIIFYTEFTKLLAILNITKSLAISPTVDHNHQQST